MSTRWTIQDVERLKNGDQKKVKVPQPKANDLTRYALKVLDYKGWHVWRQNNGGVFDPKLKMFRANSSTPGITDILGFNRKTGQFLAVEIKAGKDRLSPEQEFFLEQVRKSGGKVAVIRTFKDADEL